MNMQTEQNALRQRENNFDLLRIVSAFAVVMIHVSAGFLCKNAEGVLLNCTPLVMFFNCATRFAVPCFFMLSGAFILADERNADYKYFYKKSVKNIGVTGIVFCLLYVVYNVFKLMANVFIVHKYSVQHIIQRLLGIAKGMLTGQPFHHLWYLFTLAGIYLAAPFVIRLAADLRGGYKPVWQSNNRISCACKFKLHYERA